MAPSRLLSRPFHPLPSRASQPLQPFPRPTRLQLTPLGLSTLALRGPQLQAGPARPRFCEGERRASNGNHTKHAMDARPPAWRGAERTPLGRLKDLDTISYL